jgi:hypothetical protein
MRCCLHTSVHYPRVILICHLYPVHFRQLLAISSSSWRSFSNLEWFFFLILNNFQSISFLSVFIFGVLVSMSWQPQKYKIIRNLFLKVRSDWNQYHVRDDEIGRISHNWLIQGAIIWSRCKFYMRRRLIYIAFVCTCFCIYDRCWFI